MRLAVYRAEALRRAAVREAVVYRRCHVGDACRCAWCTARNSQRTHESGNQP